MARNPTHSSDLPDADFPTVLFRQDRRSRDRPCHRRMLGGVERPTTTAEPPRRPRGGRPRTPEPHGSVTTWLTAAEHDALIQRARQEEKSVSGMIRDLIVRTL